MRRRSDIPGMARHGTPRALHRGMSKHFALTLILSLAIAPACTGEIPSSDNVACGASLAMSGDPSGACYAVITVDVLCGASFMGTASVGYTLADGTLVAADVPYACDMATNGGTFTLVHAVAVDCGTYVPAPAVALALPGGDRVACGE